MLTASDTAFSIAYVRALEGERPPEERLFEDPYAAIFSAAGAHAAEGIRRFVEAPFFVEGVRLRTRFIDDFVRESVLAGVAQVVLLGARRHGPHGDGVPLTRAPRPRGFARVDALAGLFWRESLLFRRWA